MWSGVCGVWSLRRGLNVFGVPGGVGSVTNYIVGVVSRSGSVGFFIVCCVYTK